MAARTPEGRVSSAGLAPELLAGWLVGAGKDTVPRSCLARSTKTTCRKSPRGSAHLNTKVPPWAAAIAGAAPLAPLALPSGLKPALGALPRNGCLPVDRHRGAWPGWALHAPGATRGGATACATVWMR